MKKYTTPLLLLALAACETAPKIIPDTTADSPVVLKLRHEIMNGDKITTNWGWMLWYLPVLLLAMGWGWKEFFGKKKEDKEETIQEETPAQEKKPADPAV